MPTAVHDRGVELAVGADVPDHVAGDLRGPQVPDGHLEFGGDLRTPALVDDLLRRMDLDEFAGGEQFAGLLDADRQHQGAAFRQQLDHALGLQPQQRLADRRA